MVFDLNGIPGWVFYFNLEANMVILFKFGDLDGYSIKTGMPGWLLYLNGIHGWLLYLEKRGLDGYSI